MRQCLLNRILHEAARSVRSIDLGLRARPRSARVALKSDEERKADIIFKNRLIEEEMEL